MAIVVPQDIRNFTSNDEYGDAQLEAIIDVVENSFHEATNSKFAGVQTVTEYYDGDGSRLLKLNNYPVQSITSLEVDNGAGYQSFSTSNVLITADDEIMLGSVTASDQLSYFPEGNKNIKITYTYGYSTAPAFVKHYIILKVISQIGEKLNPEQKDALEALENRIFNTQKIV